MVTRTPQGLCPIYTSPLPLWRDWSGRREWPSARDLVFSVVGVDPSWPQWDRHVMVSLWELVLRVGRTRS